MSRVLITGSADGLGREAARRLVQAGHEVILHARDEARARAAMDCVPGAAAALTGDLASIAGTRELAGRIDAAGPCDAIVHNAGVGYRERRLETEDGLEHVFQINVLAPYLLTAVVQRPKRLIYLSSGVHRSGRSGPRRPAVGAPAVERLPGLRRFEALRRGAGRRGRPPLARRGLHVG